MQFVSVNVFTTEFTIKSNISLSLSLYLSFAIYSVRFIDGIPGAVGVRSSGLSHDFSSRFSASLDGVFKHRVHLFVVDFVSVLVFGVANKDGVGGVDEDHGEVTERTPDDDTGDYRAHDRVERGHAHFRDFKHGEVDHVGTSRGEQGED